MTERSTDELTALDELALADPRRTVERALDAARELLDMEIAYFSEFTEGQQVIRSVRGDPGSFGFGEGTAIPLDETYCKRMVAGVMPSVIRDAKRDRHVRELPPTDEADIGSYVGVPLRLPEGRIYGTLCCASHAPRHELDERDVRFMRVLARVLGDQLALEARTSGAPDRSAGPPRAAPAEAAGDEEREGLLATLSLWFAGAPNAAAAARSTLSALDEHLGTDRLQDLRLVVTELVTNSVRHAGIGPVNSVGLDVRVWPDRLRAEVTDPGPGFEPTVRGPTPDEPERVGGWGLYLVDQLTDRWGVLEDPLTRVWFEMGLEPSAPGRAAGMAA